MQNTDIKLDSFRETKPLSSYLWTVNVGDFVVKECSGFKIPIRLLARKGNSFDCTANLCFEVCRKGIEFYENIFGCEYPFDHLDLVMCPSVMYAAMESAACITFKENMFMCYRLDQMTQNKVMGGVVTILHEISHQWFGNMVTMHWWGDIWLNESFATLISYYAHEHLFELNKKVHESINSSIKGSE